MNEQAAEWRETVERWRESGLSQNEFCRRNGHLASRLSYWKRKLGGGVDRLLPAKSNSKGAESKSGFVELPCAEPRREPSSAFGAEVELEFGSGLVLRIRG